MARALLVDFGATRIKSILWDDQTGFVDACELPGVQPRKAEKGYVELPPEAYWKALEQTAGQLIIHNPEPAPDCMWLCAEMHGFLLVDPGGNPRTGYISWKDQRGGQTAPNMKRPLVEELREKYGDFFRQTTGMNLRTGLPWLNVNAMDRRKELPDGELYLLTLPDWILVRGGCSAPKTDATMAAGTGFYDLYRHCWSEKLTTLAVGSGKTSLHFPSLAATGSCLGHINLAGHILPVFGGTGDMQTAVHGAGLEAGIAMVNLGTGSQMIAPGFDKTAAPFEMRCGCRGEFLRAVTHIPAGRMLSLFAQLFDGFSEKGGGKPIFWKTWHELSADDVLNAPEIADLNVFEAAWRFTPKSGWVSIREEWVTPKDILAGLAHSWLGQYTAAFDAIDPDHTCQKLLISGGLSRRCNFIPQVLSAMTTRKIMATSPLTGEETLDGLHLLWKEYCNSVFDVIL